MNADATAVSDPVDVVQAPGRAPEAVDVGRRCSHPECQTKLSRYNPDDTCTAHGGWSDATVKRPGRKPGSAHTVPAEGNRAAAGSRLTDATDGGATSSGRDRGGRRAPVVLTSPALDLTEPSDSAVVVAELSLEPSHDTVGMRRMLRRIGNLLSQTGLEVAPRPSGVVVSGELSTIMDAVEQVHRLASRQRSEVVTTVKVIEGPED